MLKFLLKFYFLQFILIRCQIQYCENESQDKSTCLKCIDDLDFDPNISSTSCVQKNCLDFLFYDIDLKKCSSTCPNGSIGNQQTKICEQVYRCPLLNHVGQSYHNYGKVTKIILLDQNKQQSQYPYYQQSNNDVLFNVEQIENMTDIISISDQSNQIIIWDAQNGQIRAQFKAHSFPVIQLHYLPENNLLISFAEDGEVITWNYENGLALQKRTINFGQISSESPIDIQLGQIITFGYQGDFYDVNYDTLDKKSFIGHSELVTQVIQLSQELLLSVSQSDSRIVIWDRRNTQTITIINNQNDPIFPFPIQAYFKDSSDDLFIRSHVSIIQLKQKQSQNFYICITPIQLEFDYKSQIWKVEVLDEIILPNDFQNIIHIHIHSNYNYIIVLSSKDLIIFQYDEKNYTTNIKQQISQSSILQSTISCMKKQNQNQIQSSRIVALFWNTNSIILQSNYDTIYVFDYNPQADKEVLVNKSNINMNQLDSDLKGFIFIESLSYLIYFGQRIISYNLNLCSENYIIQNLQSPLPQQTEKLKTFDYSIVSQLIINTSLDGQIFIFDYYNGKYIDRIVHPQFIQEYYFPSPNIIKFVQDDIFCVSFSNYDVICYTSFGFEIVNHFSVSEDIIYMNKDQIRRMLVVITLNTASVFDLSLNSLRSTIPIEGQFYFSRFIADQQLISGYSIYGDTVLLEYPDLKIKYFVNNDNDNPDRAILSSQNEITSFKTNLSCFQNGLIIVRNLDLSLKVKFQFDFKISKCGFNPITQSIYGGTFDGLVFIQNIQYKQIFYSKRLLHFPIIEGIFDSQLTQFIFQTDFGSFGSGVLVGDNKYLTFNQLYNTPTSISFFLLDESRRRLFIQDQTNLQICKYSLYTYTLYQQLQEPIQTYNKMYLIESQYKIVTLSTNIAIREYNTHTLYRENNKHEVPPLDLIIDQDRFTIISINQNKLNNLLIWNYQDNTSFFLEGHTQGINGILFQNNQKEIFITYGKDGFIILWNNVDFKIFKKFQPHQQDSIMKVLMIPDFMISYADDQSLILTDYNDDKILLRLNTIKKYQFVVDLDYSRILFYDTIIVINSLKTGLKLQEIYGFDGPIGNVFIKDEYIIAYSILVIQCISRDTLERRFISKSSFTIFKMIILQYLAIMISNSNEIAIKFWNYKTGVMLVDLVNTFYPYNIRNIFADEEANNILAINVENQIFIFNPFVDNIQKISHYLIIPEAIQSNLSQILLDTQNNIVIIYSDKEIVTWNYFSFLGRQGNYLPNNFQIQNALSKSGELYFLNDNNLWKMQESNLEFEKGFFSAPKILIIIGETLIIGDQSSMFSLRQKSMEIITNISIKPVSFHAIESQIGNSQRWFLVVSQDRKIYKVELNENTQEISLKFEYDVVQHQSRILDLKIVEVYNHFIITDITGKMIIIDYFLDQVLSNFKAHINPIRNLVIDTKINRIMTCSEDSNIEIYEYSMKGATSLKTINEMDQASQLLLDNLYNKLYIWQYQKQEIVILRMDKNYSLEQIILSPGDNLIKLRIFDQRQYLVIFNEFQVNFHKRDNLQFKYAFRQPSSLNDITDIQFLSKDIILLITQSSLRLIKVDNDKVEIYKTFEMQLPTLSQAQINQQLPYVNIIGINLYTAFNYTIISGDLALEQTKCYSELVNTGSSFSLIKYVDNLIESIEASQQSITYAELIIFQKPFSIFQYAKTENKKGIQIQFNYKSLQTTNTTKILIQRSDQIMQETFKMERCSIFTIPQTSYTFLESTKYFIFKKQEYQNLKVNNNFVFLVASQLVQLDEELFENSEIINTKILTTPSTLFSLDRGNTAYINKLIIKNCTFHNIQLYIFKNSENLYIHNMYIEDITFYSNSSSSINNNILLSFENIHNLRIYNLTIIQKKYTETYTVLKISGNQNTQIQNLYANNLENVRLIQYSNSYSDERGSFKVKNDYLLMMNILIQDSFSNKSIFEITSDLVDIFNMTAINVNCPNCYGSVIFTEGSQINIQNSNFKNNTAMIGGSIYMVNCNMLSNIQNTNITQCNALIGGALAISNCDIDLIDSYIYENKAIIGGGVRYFFRVPKFVLDKEKQKKLLFSNTAKIFGNNLASYPRNIQIISYGSQKETLKEIKTINSLTGEIKTSYSIDSFQSGDFLNIEVKLIDEEGNSLNLDYAKGNSSFPEAISNEINSFLVQCVPEGVQVNLIGETIANIRVYDIESHSFKFTQLIMTAEPKSIQKISILSPSTFVPDPVTNIFVSQPFQIKISVQFRECIEGEEYIKKSLSQSAACRKCPEGMYSLIKPTQWNEFSDKCQICPSQAKLCQNNTIILKNGYWRENSQTDKIYKCFNNVNNCIGQSKENKNYCREGYIGPLCEMCDLSGKVWGKQFSTKNSFECEECSNSFLSQIKMVFLLLSLIIYIIFCIAMMLKQSRRSTLVYYLRRMQILSFGKSEYEDMTTVYLKGTMHYLYLTKVINNSLKMPQFFMYIDQISFPTAGLKNKVSCFNFLQQLDLGFPFIRQIIVVFLSPLLFIITVYFLIKVSSKCFYLFRQTFQEFTFFHCFIFAFTFFQPSNLKEIITFISCRRIGEKYYIIDYLELECYQRDHVNFIIFFSIPLFFIWAFILPLTFLWQIRKDKDRLQDMRITYKYGFFYKEYRLQNYYWEFVKIYVKLCVTIIDAFFQDEEIIKCSFVSIILLVYMIAIIILNPYKNISVNKHEITCHFIFLIMLIINNIGNVNDTLNEYTSIIIPCFHYFIIFNFLSHIFHHYIQFFMIKMISYFPSLAKFQYFQTFQQQQNLNRTFQNWRKLRKAINFFINHHTNISNKPDQNKSSALKRDTIDQMLDNFTKQDSNNQNMSRKNISSSSLNFFKASQEILFMKNNQSNRSPSHSFSPFQKMKKIISTKNSIDVESKIQENDKLSHISSNLSYCERNSETPSLSNYNFDSKIQTNTNQSKQIN